MDNLKENLYKITTFCGILLGTLLFDSNIELMAQEVCETNLDSFFSSCFKTPETYKTRIYEMGLCTSDPLAGTYNDGENLVTDNMIDESTCTPVLQSQSGDLIDISPGVVQSLAGEKY